MAKLSQLRVRAEELRIDNYPRMRKSELETEIHKKEQAITAESTPQPTNPQRANKQEVT
jgi:Rho termination factor, N-terminal domain